MMNISNGQQTINILHSSGIGGIMTDDISEPSSPESTTFEEADLLTTSINDDVTTQLAAAGPIGVAAAAAIATSKKRKRPHSFETNPSIRKRQQTRLLRKLKNLIEEYSTRIGQQAIVLAATPGKGTTAASSNNSFRVFGSQPLESVIRGSRPDIMRELEAALAAQAPPAAQDNPALHELPPLVIDGIPTPVDKMTQAQLRAFIPEMLKYSTGRSKPGWGKNESRPLWWPNDVPWANVRSDVRSEEIKKKVSWTHALRTIVRNCYRHHGREDLLPEFNDDHTLQVQHITAGQFSHQTMVQHINNPDGTVSTILIDTGDGSGGPQVVTLADGTQAQVVHAISGGHEASAAVQTLADVAAGTHQLNPAGTVSLEGHNMATLAEATINSEGQLILTGGDAAAALGGMVSIPVSVYQTVVTSMAQLHGDQAAHGNVQIAMAPMQDEHGGLHAATIKEMVDSEESDSEQMVVAANFHADNSMDDEEETTAARDDDDEGCDNDEDATFYVKNVVPDNTQTVEIMTIEQHDLKDSL